MSAWIDAGAFEDIDDEDVVRFDHEGRTFAVYRFDDTVYASDGLCTHEQV
ncbi:MAG: Rieske 2Fe-2S domain-containing protein, partial [Burkholderiales bacterium]|nr:Rieske 2Fe-2S domain-containing protein [Burkholderiales bacterium]